MVRISVIDGYSSVVSRERMEQVKDIFRASFPELADLADEIPHKLKDPVKQGYLSKLIVLEKGQQTVMGFAYVIHFPSIKASFLDFLAVRPGQRGGGIGGSLHEAVQEHCRKTGSKHLYLEVVPDDPVMTPDPQELKDAKKRIRFYERYGARVIINAAYSQAMGNPPTYSLLLVDSLGTDDMPDTSQLKTAMSTILLRRFFRSVTPEYISEVLEDIQNNGVILRPAIGKAASVLPKQSYSGQRFSLVYNPRHVIHHIQEKGYLESPVRLQSIMDALEGSELFEVIKARKYKEDVLYETHSRELVTFLKTVCPRLKEDSPFYPDTFPIRRPDHKPKNLAVQAGYYCLDDGTPLYKGAYIGAKAALDTALTAADEILAGRRLAYAVCRPPGHHAGRNFFGGFCYFNNAAAAAQYLSAEYTTAILDLDFHHGNGTQDIFYQRRDILTLSIHGDPDYSYPYFSGFSTETGEGEGLGYNINLPLPPETGEELYLRTLDKALKQIKSFGAEVLVVSLGYDTLQGDPTGTFNLSYFTMTQIATRLSQLDIPLLIIQEGGYHLNNIKQGCMAFFNGFLD